jgi:hypothetical protein
VQAVLLSRSIGNTRFVEVDFMVAIQPSAVGQPSEGTFDDATLGQNDELAGLVAGVAFGKS